MQTEQKRRAQIIIPRIKAQESAPVVLPGAREEITIILPPLDASYFDTTFIDSSAVVDTQPLYSAPPFKGVLLAVIAAMLLPLAVLSFSLYLALTTPAITVTLFSKEQAVQTTNTIQLVKAQALQPITIRQAETSKASGKAHQDATTARGTITIFNGLYSEQFVPAGTQLLSSSGIAVATDQPVTVPAGNPPFYGQATVPAHALTAGASGNIAAYSINTACCFASGRAENTVGFIGGQDARDYTYVRQSDIARLTADLLPTVTNAMQQHLNSDLAAGEEVYQFPCSPRVSSNHSVGDEATNLTVSVSETCNGIAYDPGEIAAKASEAVTQKALLQLGSGYELLGMPTTDIQTMNRSNTAITARIQCQGVLIYRVPNLTGLKTRLLGRNTQQVVSLLRSLPSIESVQITGIDQEGRLPKNADAIHLLVMYGLYAR
jgi:Baseplate J-like protein